MRDVLLKKFDCNNVTFSIGIQVTGWFTRRMLKNFFYFDSYRNLRLLLELLRCFNVLSKERDPVVYDIFDPWIYLDHGRMDFLILQLTSEY